MPVSEQTYKAVALEDRQGQWELHRGQLRQKPGARSMSVSEQTYKAVALEDPEGQWELHCGQLRQKPGMSFEHDYIMPTLANSLARQLDPDRFRVTQNGVRLRISTGSFYIPDICVLPMELMQPHRGSYDLAVYQEPVLLVVEVWSPSTGDYDVEVNLREYQRRGDLEIWRVHPFEWTLTAWRKQPDGSYLESLHRSGTVLPAGLPGVSIDLDALFA
jgi:Uma2 family endonuclease